LTFVCHVGSNENAKSCPGNSRADRLGAGQALMLELSFHLRPILCVTSMQTRTIIEPAMVGFRPVFAEHAIEAIRTANSEVFDAYLIDYWVPEWTGLQLCRHIRQIDRHAPIVIYNGANQLGQHSRAIRAGANAFFLKPVDADALRASLTFLLDARDHNTIRAR
jgi:DNA-binding NtrC family response regulator